MCIAILGAGGIGSYFGGRLAAAGEDVVFIARGATLEALRSTGLVIESPAGDLQLPQIKATDRPEDVGPVDIVLFCVKLFDVDQAAAALGPLVGLQTLVVTTQNGVDAADMVARHVPRAQVVRAAAFITAHRIALGVVRHYGDSQRLMVEGFNGDSRVAAFAAAGNAAGFQCVVNPSGEAVIWTKFVALAAFSAASALIRRPLGELRSNAETRALFLDLIAEVDAVAHKVAPSLPPTLRDGAVTLLDRHDADAYASMAEDLMHGRPLELRWMSGRVHALGVELGVPTPMYTAAYRALVLYENGATPN